MGQFISGRNLLPGCHLPQPITKSKQKPCTRRVTPRSRRLQPAFPQKAGGATSTAPESCDGHDELGCYQVRLYYDWFLIPGSCKCWKNDFFLTNIQERRNKQYLKISMNHMTA